MKKVLYILMALFISGATLNAAETQFTNKYGQKVQLKTTEPELNKNNVIQGPLKDDYFYRNRKKTNGLLGVSSENYTNLVDQLGNSIFNWNFEQTMANPISYDPTLGDNGLMSVMNMEPDYSAPGPGGGGGPVKLTLSMYYSSDKGYNWTMRDSVGFYPTTPFYYTAPTLGIVNTDKTQTIGGLTSNETETFDYVIYSRNYSSTEFTYSGMGFFINLVALGEKFVSDYKNPDVNDSPDPQMWGFANVATSNTEGNSGIYFVSQLSPDGDASQFGYYGNIGLGSTSGGITGNLVPSQFWADKFRPSESLGTSFQNRPMISTDDLGNVYVAAINFFADDIENRVPGVWKSTNGGNTWGEVNKCPTAVLNEVVGTLGNGATGFFNLNYSQDAFVAYGEENYSVFMRIVSTLGTDNLGLHIVEVSYKDGVWSARKVADISENIGSGLSLPTWLGINARIGERFMFADTVQLPLMEEVNNRGHELQAALTADGNSLVLKYIDWSGSKTVTFDSTYTYYTEGLNEFGLEDTIPVQVDYDLPNDIFMISRDLSSNEWGEEYNVTNDNWNYRNTFMPAIVPSKTEVPIVMSNSALVTNPASRWYNAIGKLNTSYWSQVSHYWFQAIDVINVDGTRNAAPGPSPQEGESGNVKNTINNDFKLLEPYPNPAINQDVELSFVLNQPGYVKVTINDALGNLVEVAYEGNLSSGAQGFPIKTDKYASGTYYVNLSVGNNTATKILNIVK